MLDQSWLIEVVLQDKQNYCRTSCRTMTVTRSLVDDGSRKWRREEQFIDAGGHGVAVSMGRYGPVMA